MGDLFIIVSGPAEFKRQQTTRLTIKPQSAKEVALGKASGALGAATSAASENVVQRNRAAAKKDEGEGERCRRQGELVSGVVGPSEQPVVQVRFPDGDAEVNADHEGGDASEESPQDQDSAEKLGEGGNICQPRGDAEAGHPLRGVMESSKYFVIAVRSHDGTQSDAHDEKGERLQAIEIAQGILLREQKRSRENREIEYRNPQLAW